MTGPEPSLLSVIGGQRACRAFSDDPVPDEALHALLEAATHAPSAQNEQPWVFVVVRDAERRAAIAELTAAVWHGGARDHAAASIDAAFLSSVDGFVQRGYGGAPVLVVVAGDGRAGATPAVLSSSVFPAVQNLLLAAAALGYGSSMTTLAAQAPAALGQLVGLPEGVRPFAVVPIGRPARRLGPPRRRPVEDVAHLEQFGTPFSARQPSPAAPPRPAPPPA